MVTPAAFAFLKLCAWFGWGQCSRFGGGCQGEGSKASAVSLRGVALLKFALLKIAFEGGDGGEGALQGGAGLARASVEAGLDLVDEDGAAPAVFHCVGGVPEAFGLVFELLQQGDGMAPGDL